MALVLNGNGSMTVGNGDITGLDNGALPTDVLGSGAVLQVVSAQNTTQVTVNTGIISWVNTGTSATITPKFSSSRILVMVQQSIFHENTTATGTGFRIYRNGSAITADNGYTASYQGADRIHAYTPITYMDSPGSTSALTYTIYGLNWATGGQVQYQYSGSESPSRIILMEIAG